MEVAVLGSPSLISLMVSVNKSNIELNGPSNNDEIP